MRFLNSLMAVFALPFIAAKALVMLFIVFTLFCIFKNWNQKHNKELMNALILSTILLFVISVFSAFFTRISFGYYIKAADIFIPVLAIIITALIYFVGNSSGEKIYPNGYFDQMSNLEFLKRELSLCLDYLISSFKKTSENVRENAFNENSNKYDPNYSGHGRDFYNSQANYNSNYNPNYAFQGYRNLESAPFRGYLKDDWSFLLYLVLSIITCGLYQIYFIYKVSESINIACAGDGEETSGALKFIGFGFLTCGIYCMYWDYKIMNRMQANGPRYNRNIQDNGASFLLWLLVGSFVCGLGSFFAWYIFIKNVNAICNGYNLAHANRN